MKVVLIIFVFGFIALESTNAQCLVSPSMVAGPVVSPAMVTSNTVATTLADTLSLLTVSSLLSEKLPFGYPAIAPIAPIGPVATVAPVVSGCGCGCGYGGYGYPYGPYVL